VGSDGECDGGGEGTPVHNDLNRRGLVPGRDVEPHVELQPFESTGRKGLPQLRHVERALGKGLGSCRESAPGLRQPQELAVCVRDGVVGEVGADGDARCRRCAADSRRD